MKRAISIVAGFATAALLAAILLAITTALLDKVNPITGLALVPLYLFFTGVATLIAGVPTFLILNKFNLINLWSAIGVGCFIGGIAGLLMKQGTYEVIVMASVGMIAGVSFWFVWKRGNWR